MQNLDFMRDIFDDVADTIANDHECYSADVHEIESEARDGFIPFTDGGLRAMCMTDLRSVWGSGASVGPDWLQTQIQEIIDDCLADTLADFRTDNPDLVEKHGPEFDYCTLYDAADFGAAESLADQEMCRLSEGGEFWLELRAQYYDADNYRNRSGKPEVWFCVGVNLDFTYGRDSGLTILRECNVSAARLTPTRARTICETLAGAL